MADSLRPEASEKVQQYPAALRRLSDRQRTSSDAFRALPGAQLLSIGAAHHPCSRRLSRLNPRVHWRGGMAQGFEV